MNLHYGRDHPAYLKFVVSMSFAIASNTSKNLNRQRGAGRLTGIHSVTPQANTFVERPPL
jgi:hypothetical protein